MSKYVEGNLNCCLINVAHFLPEGLMMYHPISSSFHTLLEDISVSEFSLD